MSDINYDEIDPGIRGLVRKLREKGFETVDSGDGVSKLGEMEDALPFPHVAMLSTPGELVSEADRLMVCLAEWGVSFEPALPLTDPQVEASYSPVDGHAVLMITNVDDKMLGLSGGG